MTLRERINLAFIRRLLATPEGRAHVLTQVADAEGSDEAAIFDRLRTRVSDDKLEQLIAKHQADEQRHEALFRACAARAGAEVPPAPADLKLLDRLNVATGRFLDAPFAGDEDVMRAYLLLQVIEERAITQFKLFERAFRDLDPATADTFVEVAKDEERHLKYCHAIARRYAPDEKTRIETLARFRRIEAKVFAENGYANQRYAMEHGWFAGGPIARAMWQALGALQARGGGPETDPARAERLGAVVEPALAAA